jgi:hypothetical protein
MVTYGAQAKRPAKKRVMKMDWRSLEEAVAAVKLRAG